MRFRALLAAALSCVSLTGLAKSPVAVSLLMLDRAAGDEVNVQLTFTNTGSHAVRLLNWYVPDGEPEDDVFTVTRDGREVSYMGPHIKRPGAVDADFIVLQPGESVTRIADIGAYYDLRQSGEYTIQYQVSATQLLPGDAGAASAFAHGRYGPELTTTEQSLDSGLIASNEVIAQIAGRKNPFLEQALNTKADLTVERGADQAVSFSGGCSGTQQSTLLSAVSAGSTMANGAVSYLNGTPAATTRYTTWFGTFSTANWNQVKGQFAKIKDAFDTKPLTLDCKCKKTYYAYVYPNQPYKIYLCKAFWSAPLSGTDSKGGTLVHELSHFTVIAGTDDWAYGQTAAKSLALSDPTKARNNADSHEYFAENTPALP
ncbi:MAG: peptidase M35 [Betaproteobacteria bacterium]|nr:peptidase M35 [Betaproteobacteria bacterium]